MAELVSAHCRRTGESMAEVAARGGMSRQTLSGLVNRTGPKALPRTATLEALARGLELPFETVRHVAAETAYGEPDEAPDRKLLRTLVAQASALTDAELEAVLAVVRALKRLGHPNHAA